MKRFQPKKNENYWMINSRWEIKQSVNTGSKKFDGRVRAGNCFATEKEAKDFLHKVKALRNGHGFLLGTKLSYVQKIKLIIGGKI